MASFVILLTTRTTRTSGHTHTHTYTHTHTHTHTTTTIYNPRAHRGLIIIMKSNKLQTLGGNIGTFGLETP